MTSLIRYVLYSIADLESYYQLDFNTRYSFSIHSIIHRTKQGPFELDDDSVHILPKEEWSPENIYNAVEQGKERLEKLKMEEKDLE